MRNLAFSLILALGLTTNNEAYAFWDKHPILDSVRMAPVHAFRWTGRRTLAFGKWYETSGASGVGSFASTCLGMGALSVLSTRRF